MAVATLTDFKIYNPQVQSAIRERLSLNLNAFNGASNNVLRMLTEAKRGELEKTAFFEKLGGGAVARRNPALTTGVDDIAFEQGEIVEIKVNRRIGPIAWTLDSLRKAGVTPETASFYLGEQIADLKMQDMLNTGLLCTVAALSGQTSTNVIDKTGASSAADRKLQTEYLIDSLALFGDQPQRIRAWVSHSRPMWNLMKDQLSVPVTNVADRVIYGASIGTMNRPLLPTDIPALKVAADATGEVDAYVTMGLVQDAVIVTETEQSEIISQPVLGNENLMVRIQGEYAINLRVQGFAWNVGTGGTNPTDAALGNSANWTKIMESPKDLAGVYILTN